MQTIEQPTIEAEQTDPEQFHITTDAAANWYLRKLANLEAEQRRIQQQAAAIVKQLEGDAERLRYLYEGELAEYVQQKLTAAGSRRKSVHFLQGTAGFRTVPARLIVTDERAAIAYACECLPTRSPATTGYGPGMLFVRKA
jgi:hypothetical protein